MQNNGGAGGQPIETNAASDSLYRIDGDGKIQRLSSIRFGITNTMVWQADGGFVSADTALNRFYRFRMRAGGMLDAPETFGSLIDRGLLDGSTQGSTGQIYNCRTAEGTAVARIAANDRQFDYLALPCSSPTRCTFGGRDYQILFVTSARFGMTDGHISSHPHEGTLMAIDTNATGLPGHMFVVRGQSKNPVLAL